MANSIWDGLEEVQADNTGFNTNPIENKQPKQFKSVWDDLEEIPDNTQNDEFNPNFEEAPEHPYFDAAKGLLKGGIKTTQDFTGALNAPVQNPNVAQGLGNIARDLGQFGKGLVQGIPHFLGDIKRQAVETGTNLQQNPNNWGAVLPAIGHGVDKALGDMVSGVLNLPESVAASYMGREVNPHFTSTAPFEFYADKANELMLDKGLISQKQYEDYLKHKLESQQKQSQVPIAGTLGEFIPAMIPVGKAAGLLGGAGKTAQTAENLSKAQKIAQTAKDIGKAGAVGAGYGFVVNPEASLAERAQAAGSGTAAGALLGAGGKAVQAGGRAAAPYVHNAAKNTAYAAGKGTRAIFDAATEIKDRLNPNNYETVLDAQPVERGMGLSQRTVYEAKPRTIYKKPNKTRTAQNFGEAPKIAEQRVGTDFVMGEGSELKTPARPNRAQKLLSVFENNTSEKAGVLDNNARISRKEEERKKAIEKIKKLAPNTAAKLETKSNFVVDNDGVYEKIGENQLRNVDTNEVFTPSDMNSYSEWQYDPSELRKPYEFKYNPKAKAGENADNYVLSRPEVVEAYNNYVKSPTEANREIYEDTYGKYNHEYYQIKDKFEKADKVTKIAPKTVAKIQETNNTGQASDTSSNSPVFSAAKNKKVKKNTSIQTYVGKTHIKETDKYYTDGSFIVKKDKFSLKGNGTTNQTHERETNDINTVFNWLNDYTYNPATVTDEAVVLPNETKPKAVKLEYTDKDNNKKSVLIAADHLEKQFKGYDFAVSNETRNGEPFIQVLDNGEPVGYVATAKSSLTEKGTTVSLKDIRDKKAAEKAEKTAKKAEIKYDNLIPVKDENGNLKYHTDGNALYLADKVTHDFKNAYGTSPKLETVEAMIKGSDKFNSKLKETGVRRKVSNLGTILQFKTDSGDYVWLNKKYLLNGKGIEVFAEKPNATLQRMAIRRNGEFIGIVMPVNMREFGKLDTDETYTKMFLSEPKKVSQKIKNIAPKTAAKLESVNEKPQASDTVAEKETQPSDTDENLVKEKLEQHSNYKAMYERMQKNGENTQSLEGIIKRLENQLDHFKADYEKVNFGDIDVSQQRKNKILEYAKNIKESPDYNAEYAKETIEALAESSRFSKNHNDVELKELIKDDYKNGDALAYIGQIYGKENGNRAAQQQKGLEILRENIFGKIDKSEQKMPENKDIPGTIIKLDKIYDGIEYPFELENKIDKFIKQWEDKDINNITVNGVDIIPDLQQLKSVLLEMSKNQLIKSEVFIGENHSNANKPKTAQVEAKSEQVKPKESTSKVASKKKEAASDSIQDSGEFLRGNRKTNDNLTWDDLQGMNEVVRAKNLTKAKIYKKPTLESLQERGLGQYQSALAIYVYNHIAAKAPERNVEDQKLYVDNISSIMDKVVETLKANPDELTWEFVNDNYSYYYAAKNGYIAKESNKLLDAIFPDKDNKVGRYGNIFRVYPEYNKLASIMGGSRFVKALQIRKSNTKEIEKIWDSFNAEKKETAKKENWEKNFTILEPDRYNPKYQVGTAKKKNGYNQIIGGEFNTREEAIEFARKLTEMQAQAKAELKKANFERDYVQRRDKDITSDELREAFGFKGVNFGNYVNQKERQGFLNYAYDSLYDLAELLNLPPKALSLNGNLGLAFGAQGHGGKAAGHYIPDYQEINMTKDSGAGTLAHEWWHALDNYFGYKSKGKDYSLSFGTDIKEQGNLRPEVFNALKNISDKIKNVPLTEKEITERKNNIIARCERNIEYYANEVKNTFRNVEGVADFVDNIVKNKEKYINMSDEERHNLEWTDFAKLIPEKRQTIQNMAKFSWLTGEIQRIGRAEEVASRGMGKTEYYKSAEKLNEIEKMGNGYWTEPTELGARAFTTWLLDKMETKQMVNKFLSRSQDGEVSFDFKELAKELQSGEEKQSKIYWNPKEPEEIARIFDAFNKLFDTIKTRETDKGIEIYNVDIPEFMKKAQEVDTGYKDLDLTPVYEKISQGIKGSDLAKILPEEIRDIITGDANNYTFGELANKEARKRGVHIGKKTTIALNLEALGNSPYAFIETLTHEIKHANQRKTYLKIMSKPKHSWTPEERTFVAHYNICKKVNKERQTYYNKHKKLIDKFDQSHYYSAEERAAAISQLKPKEQSIIDKHDNNVRDYWNALFEVEARTEGAKNAAGYRKESRYTLSRTSGTKQANNGTSKKRNILANDRNSTAEYSEAEPEYKQREVKEAALDKVYEWHGNIGKDRFDVDKALNSFVNLTKGLGKEYSKKLGMNVTDKMVREVMPFLRERTGLPEKLNRPELKKFFDKLSGAEKARLTDLADKLSAKLDKYYKNYEATNGVIDAEGIENHISHIWDLDSKKKSLMTNYFTTSSKFAKNRTIDTLVKGIDGFEVNGELIQFKPKTLDYAEILKTSSDNLIKATHDRILADELKKLKHNGKPLVMESSKAPSDWVEISHPALNKSVYTGTTNDNNLIFRKGTVKVHPDVAPQLSAIFEVQKADNAFWKAYDTVNGLLKQSTLGFSGFHGYALSESAASNVGLKNTISELNIKKIYDSVKNGDYEVFKNEEIVKQAIEDGVQIGTPQSDINRGQVEEALGRIPKIGKYLQGATEVNNKILWDCLHTMYKVRAYEYLVNQEGGLEKTTKQQRRDIAQWVNDSFGGQAWELLGIKGSTIKAAGRVLLSPDWNFSTIRQTMGLFDGKTLENIVTGKDNKFWSFVENVAEKLGAKGETGAGNIRGKAARAFFLRFIIYSAIGYNLINAAFRERDRKKHPELYPKNMKPVDYTIWANSLPNDKFFDKVFPYVFIGRNKDGSARYLRVGKQVREVPEMLSDPVNKFGGKSASILNMISQTALGISPADIPKMMTGDSENVYYNQNIWKGYGKYANRREGADLIKGMGKTAINSALPFVMSKAIDEKHDTSAWDMFAQTSRGLTYGKTVREFNKAYINNQKDEIQKIGNRAYQDGMTKDAIEAARKNALKKYRTDNSLRYKHSYVEAMQSNDRVKVQQITNEMKKKHLPVEEQKRIYDAAYKEFMKEKRR